ncbi:hypothetical protein [Streptomyces sp. S.PB5]|uniref:hypothetical protein n=1 Tax=Streptomyces sp. S.PB5 TaxID=3020844 RepID=UPI0025AF0CD7|nr:hypothetical protein [Streptomyces sp. S.PB5]MDN3027508.1 hypothetical protein [Streptomyces sp. S.PB5]
MPLRRLMPATMLLLALPFAGSCDSGGTDPSRTDNALRTAASGDEVLISTHNGDVTVTHSGLVHVPLRLSTHSGSVRATSLEAARVHASTVNGSVDVTVPPAMPRPTASP